MPAMLALAARLRELERDGPVAVAIRRQDGGGGQAVAGVPLGAPANPLSPQQLTPSSATASPTHGDRSTVTSRTG